MDRKSIEEYDAKEQEQTQKLMSKAETKLQKGGGLSVTDFFPDFEGKLFSNYILDERLPVQLVFSRGLFVSVEPFLTGEMFSRHYGITVDELRELSINGIVTPVINCGLWRYADVDYLDEIIEEFKPPTYHRLTGFFRILSDDQYLRYYREGEHLFRNQLSSVAKRKNWDIFYPCGLEAYETKASYDFARIKCLYPWLLEGIDFTNPIYAADQVLYYDELFIDSFTHAYEGLHKISSQKLKFQIPSTSTSEVFHNDISQILVRSFRLEYPRDIDIDTLKEVIRDPVTSKGKKAIAELDKAVQKLEGEKACERAVALTKIWKETCDAMTSLTKRESIIEKTIATVGVAAIGATIYQLTGNVADSVGFASLTYTSLKSKSGVISGKIAKLRKPIHVSTCWDYASKIKKIKRQARSQ
jgi:hypothetical protein